MSLYTVHMAPINFIELYKYFFLEKKSLKNVNQMIYGISEVSLRLYI